MLISFLQNRIIGEDKTLSIKLGADAGNASTDDIIVIRGVSKDVDRAVKEIQKIVEDAKNDEIVSSYVRPTHLIHMVSNDLHSFYVHCSLLSSRLTVNMLAVSLVLKVPVSTDSVTLLV